MGALSNAWENLKRDVDTIKNKGFKTMSASADEGVKAAKSQYGDQLSEDMKLSPEERAAKVRKGFMEKYK